MAIPVNNLGLVLHALGEVEAARAACQRALAIDEAAFGPQHPKVAIRVNNLGGVLHDLGDHAGAKAAYERALKIDENVFGPDHPNTAETSYYTGATLVEAQRPNEAVKYLNRVLSICQNRLCRSDLVPGAHMALARALVDEPPARASDGGMIREGYDPELDELTPREREVLRLIAFSTMFFNSRMFPG